MKSFKSPTNSKPKLKTFGPHFNKPNGFWMNKTNQREFILRLAKKLNYNHFEDWYRFNLYDFQSEGGSRFYRIYDSPKNAIIKLFPEYEWDPLKFDEVPRGYWKSIKNHRNFFDRMAEKMNLKSPDDWFTITCADLKAHGGLALLNFYRRSEEKEGTPETEVLYKALIHAFPEYIWPEPPNSRRGPISKSQLHLYNTLVEIFPKYAVHHNYFHDQLHFPNSRRIMSIDIFIPSLNLGFEYQGQQHYDVRFPSEANATIRTFDRYKKDDEKRNACKTLGITLIEVPYWWDGSKSSLISTIRSSREDMKTILPDSGVEEIPKEMVPLNKKLRNQLKTKMRNVNNGKT